MKCSNKGFTLIELMVVIVIMGILAVLAVPRLTDVITKAKVSEVPIVLGSWENAQSAYLAERGEVATSIDALAFDVEESKWFTYTASGGGANAAIYSTTLKSAVGPFAKDAKGPQSSIDNSNAVKRSFQADSTKWMKYLPNFSN